MFVFLQAEDGIRDIGVTGVQTCALPIFGMLEACMRPELITEITLRPVRRYGVDAAIFFSDIVLPLKAVGVDLDIKPGIGPGGATPGGPLARTEGRRVGQEGRSRRSPYH